MANSTADMPLSGGHPALDLANTIDSRRGRWGPDLVRSYDDIIVLAQRLALINETKASQLGVLAASHPRRATGALREARRLREAIYEIFLSEDIRRPYPVEAIQTVGDMAQRARGRQVLTEIEDCFAWLEPLNELTDLIGLFANAAAGLIIGRKERRPIRECKGDNCGWLFLDTSKSGRRRWCSEATCGTHERVKRYRERRR